MGATKVLTPLLRAKQTLFSTMRSTPPRDSGGGRSVDDRLSHGLLEAPPKLAGRAALHHEQGHRCFFRLDPEAHAGSARPTVRAFRDEELGRDRIEHDLHAEAEAIPCAGRPNCPLTLSPVWFAVSSSTVRVPR